MLLVFDFLNGNQFVTRHNTRNHSIIVEQFGINRLMSGMAYVHSQDEALFQGKF